MRSARNHATRHAEADKPCCLGVRSLARGSPPWFRGSDDSGGCGRCDRPAPNPGSYTLMPRRGSRSSAISRATGGTVDIETTRCHSCRLAAAASRPLMAKAPTRIAARGLRRVGMNAGAAGPRVRGDVRLRLRPIVIGSRGEDDVRLSTDGKNGVNTTDLRMSLLIEPRTEISSTQTDSSESDDGARRRRARCGSYSGALVPARTASNRVEGASDTHQRSCGEREHET